MRKTIYLINSLLAVALFGMLIAVLSVTHSVAFAATEDSVKSDVSVTGEDIVEGNTYYLQWLNLSVVYNGSRQAPSAVLKCNEDSSFEKIATVYVKNEAGEAVTAVDVGDYVAVAECTGINFGEGENEKEFSISPLSVIVNWDKAESYTYSGQAQGPTARYTDVNGASHTLTANGYGANAGTYTASVTADAAGGNYILTNLTCGYMISPLSVAVNWGDTTRYTYNGNVQGPTASYADVSGASHTLTSSGLGTNVGIYTASVTADAAGGNYTLNNLTCEYEIGKLIGKVLWVVADYYIANGQPQVPRAFVVGVNGDFIELPINGAGTKAGEYTAEIDLSQVDSNIELSGEMSYRYKIKSENLFGPVGTALSIIFGILCAIPVGFIIYWFCFRKKKDDEQQKEDNQFISRLQNDISERDRTISGLQRANQSLIYDLAAVQDEMEQAKRSLPSLERTLAETKQKLAEAKRQLSEIESTDKEAVDKLKNKVKNLTEQVRSLSEENERLKSQKAKEPDFYKHPIEEYFPDIDAAYEYAESCDYNPNDPEGSFITQRQKLRDIMNLITIYRSQRR